MGEMADWCNDQMQDAFPEWSPWGIKKPKRTPVTCNRCGKKNLHWKNTENGWKTFTKKNELHVCEIIENYRKKFG